MGSSRKRGRVEDEIEYIERRRSGRIIALEEKKQQEKEKKLALERKKKQTKHDNKDKGKGKAIMAGKDDSSDSENDKEGSSKKKRKSNALLQLISSIKSIQELASVHSQNTKTSNTNVSSLNDMPSKQALEIIIDFLQRKDLDELFAEPVNPNVVENYYEIVKQPMDFGTMRAKLHEGMYTRFDEFKRDVCLICSNAMNTNPKTSKFYKVAEDISRSAKWIFETLSAVPEHVNSELSLNKKRQGKKVKNGQPKTSRARVSPKPAGRSNATHSKLPESERRVVYWPPSNPLVSEFLNADKAYFQLIENPSKYKDSLLRFVENLGQTAQRVADEKLEAINFQQVCNRDTSNQNPLENVSESQLIPQPTPFFSNFQQVWNGHTPNQNLLENVSGSQLIPQPTPVAPTETDTFNAQTLALALPFFNKPLTIPGSAAQGNRNVNAVNADSVNIKDGAFQGNKNEQWHACAAALLTDFFLNNGKEGNCSETESSNARGSTNIWDPSKDKMVSPLENVSSFTALLQDNTDQNHELQLGINRMDNTGFWNTSANIPDTLVPRRSSNVLTQVYPTRVISGPPPKPLKPILSGNINSISRLSLLPHQRSKYTMPSTNLPKLSLASQPRPEGSMSYRPSNNPIDISLRYQPRPSGTIDLSDLYHASQPKLKASMSGMPSNNPMELSLVHQPWPVNTMSGMNPSVFPPMSQPTQRGSSSTKNLSELAIFPSQAANFSNEPNNSLYSSGTPYRLRDLQAILGSPNFNTGPFPMQASHEQIPNQAAAYTPPVTRGFSEMQKQIISQPNPNGPNPWQEPKATSAPEMPLGGAMNYYGGSSTFVGQPKETTQLLWDDDDQPNLALQL